MFVLFTSLQEAERKYAAAQKASANVEKSSKSIFLSFFFHSTVFSQFQHAATISEKLDKLALIDVDA